MEERKDKSEMTDRNEKSLCDKGLVVYARRPFYGARSPFSEQLRELESSRDDLAISIMEDVSVFMRDGRLGARLADGTIIEQGNLPKWVMFRGDDWALAYALESIGCSVFPSSSYIRTSADKMLTHIALAGALRNYDALLQIGDIDLWRMKTPYMIKGRTGHGGAEVKRVAFPSVAVDGADEMSSRGIRPMLQQLAPAPDDLRVYIVGKEILYAVLRKSANGSDKANFCQGAQGEARALTENEKEYVLNAVDAFPGNNGFISMDFFIGEDGSLVLNEINCFPGILGLQELGCDKGFAEDYIAYLDATAAGRDVSAEETFRSVLPMRALA